MSLEGKDFDDASIMAATDQETGKNDSFRLKIKLPLSGREVTSEWISQDKRKPALFAWVDAIRNEVQADAQAYEAERKAQALATRAKQSPLVGADGAALSGKPPTESTLTSTVPATAAPSAAAPTAVYSAMSTSNPDEYIEDQLKRALIREAEASDALMRAQREHSDAQNSLAKWQKLHVTLKGV